ncbi:MAG TPA: hypothetical protein VEY09_19230 [Pyrinomonadaceae bacterium]|nr:hypothetical protein [Pyrinomonadaceae bacterium]
MKSLTDILLWVVGLLAFLYSAYALLRFTTAVDPETRTPNVWAGTPHLYAGLAAFVVAIVCLGLAYARRPHVEEEIHITK